MSREEHSDDALELATKQLRDADVPAFSIDAIARHMRSRVKPEAAPLRIRRTSWMSRIAASILVGVGLLGIAWAVFRSNPVIAFAMTAERLHEARTLSADLILNAPGMQIHGTITYAAPGRFRVSIPGAPVEILDISAGKIVLLDSMNKSATVLNLDDAPADSKRAEVDWIEKLRNVSHDAGKPLGVATINGVRAAQFSVTDHGQEILVWSDASTGEPIRIETKLISGKNVMTMALDHLAINPPIDDQQFSVSIPPGYTTRSGLVSGAPLSEDDLIRFFKEYSARTGSFPSSPADYMHNLERMVTPGMNPAHAAADPSFFETVARLTRATSFVNQLPPSSDWHYNPAAKPSDQTAPLFWYRVSGQKDYHVIRADFAVQNTTTPPTVAGAETPVIQK